MVGKKGARPRRSPRPPPFLDCGRHAESGGTSMPAKTGETKISQYLNEAQATEQALIQTLAAHIAMTPAGSYREALEGHLEETREHSRSVGERLREVGPDPGLAGIAVRAA